MTSALLMVQRTFLRIIVGALFRQFNNWNQTALFRPFFVGCEALCRALALRVAVSEGPILFAAHPPTCNSVNVDVAVPRSGHDFLPDV